MALEAVVFSEALFGCPAMPAEAAGQAWGGSTALAASSSNTYGAIEGPLELDGGNACSWSAPAPAPEEIAAPAGPGRRKRRRARSVKNVAEVESQRMTHIAVERNRRRQMNDYLASLRSLMPPSYVQRGDQASIIGGAINYVKELEQLLQSLEARRHESPAVVSGSGASADVAPFAGFFTFPQYTMRAPDAATATASSADDAAPVAAAGGNSGTDTTDIAADATLTASSGSKQSAVAEIEATIVESHASLKVLTRRRGRPRQLLRLVAGLQRHRLAVLHLNATGAGHMALYSLSLKVEDDCRLSSVDDIAAAVHSIIETIEQEEQQRSCS